MSVASPHPPTPTTHPSPQNETGGRKGGKEIEREMKKNNISKKRKENNDRITAARSEEGGMESTPSTA